MSRAVARHAGPSTDRAVPPGPRSDLVAPANRAACADGRGDGRRDGFEPQPSGSSSPRRVEPQGAAGRVNARRHDGTPDHLNGALPELAARELYPRLSETDRTTRATPLTGYQLHYFIINTLSCRRHSACLPIARHRLDQADVRDTRPPGPMMRRRHLGTHRVRLTVDSARHAARRAPGVESARVRATRDRGDSRPTRRRLAVEHTPGSPRALRGDTLRRPRAHRRHPRASACPDTCG